MHDFLDLGFAPPSNAYLSSEDLVKPEKYYPLKVKVCDQCWLVQTEDYAEADELFSADYAYYSSTSSSWLKHAATFSESIVEKLSLASESFVIEVASNDGYLLKNFVEKKIPCLGIEPTLRTASVAKSRGIDVITEFFSEDLACQLAAQGKKADLIIGNNVYAHVPDINDFTRGLKAALKPGGTITLEFPHLMRLIEGNQFDTIYHEHFSYFSITTAAQILAAAGLRVFDVEELSTHGGSVRLYSCHEEDARRQSSRLLSLLQSESVSGVRELKTYRDFQVEAEKIKNVFCQFLIEKKMSGYTVAAYGAAAKGNTLLNFAGIKPDLLPFVCDAAEAKQGMYLPGSHIPIFPPALLRERRPDFLVILPWNILDEVVRQNNDLVEQGTRIVTFLPELLVQ